MEPEWFYIFKTFKVIYRVISIVARCNTTAAPEKIEVFVDDKPVYVEPGTTILQVLSLFDMYSYRDQS